MVWGKRGRGCPKGLRAYDASPPARRFTFQHFKHGGLLVFFLLGGGVCFR